MKFGFNNWVLVGVLAVLLTGCSTRQSGSSHRSDHSSVTTMTKKQPSRRVNNSQNHKTVKTAQQDKLIWAAEQQCQKAAGGKTSVYVAPFSPGRTAVMLNDQLQRAASVIKVFIMIEAFRQIKAGRLRLNQIVQIPVSDRVGGTGTLANQNVSRITISRLLQLMIRDSDNTATNVLIDQLGGLRPVNAEIKQLHCSSTKLRRKMLDYQALRVGKDNVTSVADLGRVLSRLARQQLLGAPYDKQMLTLMRYNANQSKLPAKINQRAVVFNKTGEFPEYGVQNDAAIVVRHHQRFVVVVLSQNGQAQNQINAMQTLGKQLFSILFS